MEPYAKGNKKETFVSHSYKVSLIYIHIDFLINRDILKINLRYE